MTNVVERALFRFFRFVLFLKVRYTDMWEALLQPKDRRTSAKGTATSSHQGY
jgi:uncharacterized membrane protein